MADTDAIGLAPAGDGVMEGDVVKPPVTLEDLFEQQRVMSASLAMIEDHLRVIRDRAERIRGHLGRARRSGWDRRRSACTA